MSDPTVPPRLRLEDGSTWPAPALDSDDHYSPAHHVAWYGHEDLTREAAMWLVSAAEAYAYLIANPVIARYKIPMIRRALQSRDTHPAATRPTNQSEGKTP